MGNIFVPNFQLSPKGVNVWLWSNSFGLFFWLTITGLKTDFGVFSLGSLRDWVYDLIASHRYKWFGKADEACSLLTSEQRDRLIGRNQT